MLFVFFQPVPEYQPVLFTGSSPLQVTQKRKTCFKETLNFCEHKAVSIATSGLFKDVFSNCAE